jgi:hypothetical protein
MEDFLADVSVDVPVSVVGADVVPVFCEKFPGEFTGDFDTFDSDIFAGADKTNDMLRHRISNINKNLFRIFLPQRIPI